MPEVISEFTVDQSIEETWNFFNTPDQLAPCVPGCESVEEINEDLFNAEVTVDIAYTTLTFNTQVKITDKERPESMTVGVEASPKGRMPGTANADGGLELGVVDEDTTEGEITIEFSIFGRLGSLGESAFTHKCEEITDQFIENVVEKLELETATAE